ncbi:hypothetical protein ACS0TY_018456 [Phlomoides rotata]
MSSVRKLVAFASSTGVVALSFVPLVVAADERTRLHNIRPSNKLKGNPKLSYEIELHGFLLWGSVGILMPISILIKRMTNRDQASPGRKQRIIFYLHAITQVLAVLVAAAGGVMSIKYFDNSFNNEHQKIGLVFYGLVWLQILVSFFKPHRGSKGRRMGISTSLIGVINIYTGIQSYHERTSKDVRIWTIIFMVEMSFILLVYLLQEKWHHIQMQSKDDAGNIIIV